MRLRYLRLGGLPPLGDIRAVFRQEPMLDRDCAIRFVVGVNGTGKTRLLLALAEVFLHLERRQMPPFPVTLAYDVGMGDDRRTVLLHSPNGGATDAAFKEFAEVIADPPDDDWQALAALQPALPLFAPPLRGTPFVNGDLPGEGAIYAYLPSVLLAYTSGALDPWEALFAAPVPQAVVAALPQIATTSEETPGIEMPRNWDWRRENERRQSEFVSQLRQRLESEPDLRLSAQHLPPLLGPEPSEFAVPPSSIGRLVTPELLSLAVCAVTLHQLALEIREYGSLDALQIALEAQAAGDRPQPGLRGLLNEVGWLWPMGLHLAVQVDPADLTAAERTWWRKLYKLASSVVRQPEPSQEHRLSFDLVQIIHADEGDRSLAEVLSEHLSSGYGSPYGIFDHLSVAYSEGRLRSATLTIRKQAVEDLLLYDWLSDGERMFLGRMALFHLLRGRGDALVLLDEPETHFNDVWKRRLVDIIDDSLRDDPSEVVISTHSSIALTDVFDTEISLVRKGPAEATSAIVRTPMQTFGASPSDVMRGIFEAPDTVGQRASEFLDMILVAAAYPAELAAVWAADDRTEPVTDGTAFQTLWTAVQKLPHAYESETRLLRALRGVRKHAQQVRGYQDVTVADVLDCLEDRLGPGYYQFEFQRRLRALKKGSNGAASSQPANVP